MATFQLSSPCSPVSRTHLRLHFPDTRLSVRPSGSPAELCRLRVDDEIVAVNGLPVAHMSRPQWTEKMTSSLQMGSVTMDIRRYGSKGEKMGESCGVIVVFFKPPVSTMKLTKGLNFRQTGAGAAREASTVYPARAG